MEIKAHLNKPYVFLDKGKCTLTVKGRSYPEHPDEFYKPILEEVIKCSDYMEGSDITINLALEIMNSLSAKYIYKILKEIETTSRTLVINWYYEDDDEDMKEEGMIFNSAFKYAKFHLKEVKDINTL